MVLRRTAALFRAYVREHAALTAGPVALTDAAGRGIGAIDRIALVRNRIEVEGWTTAPRITIATPGQRQAAVPWLPRPDLAQAWPETVGTTPGFRIDLPFLPGPIGIEVEAPGQTLGRSLDPFPPGRLRRAAWRLAPRYALALAQSLPALIDWSMTRDPAAKARIKRHLGFDRLPPAAALDARLLGDTVAADPPGSDADGAKAPAPDGLRRAPPGLAAPGTPEPISIVMPVFNARAVLAEALDRVLAHTDLPFRLILVEDASTDPAVRPMLRALAAGEPPGRVEVIECDRNAGFLQAANRGLARALEHGQHVVLLNSDALVPAGWASRLLAPILADPEGVASVTPFANDAEILSVPVIARAGDLMPGEVDRIDALAARFSQAAAQAETPTGIGFCMAMSIRHLRALPGFDPAFGRGYGEEVDWCQKRRAAGGRHLALAGLFVEHRGGASFGKAEKRRLVAQNNAVISSRYPHYDAEVQEFLRTDPLATARLALAIGWAAGRTGGRPLPLYLGHSLGGGAEDYLAARIADDLDPGGGGFGGVLVLRVGTTHRWRLELHCAAGITQGATEDFGVIRALLRPAPRLHIVYSCGVDDRDPVELPDRLAALMRGPQDSAEALFHDYLPASPSYTLLDARGRFDGMPGPDATDPAHRARRPDGRTVTLADWRAAWGRFLSRCDRLVTFSENSRGLVAAAFPGAAARIVIAPHPPLADLPRLGPPAPGRRPVIGVLGNIGPQKGAAVLSALSQRLARTGAADLVLIGNIDPGFALAPQTVVHGSYLRRDIADLARRYRICCWFIPSVWPETFSFTTQECLATGLPVWCFDLGAQADQVRAAAARGGRGGVLPLAAAEGPPDDLIARLTGTAPVRSLATAPFRREPV